MVKIYIDRENKFYEIFNEKNGNLLRSNVFNSNKEPYRRNFPELLDIGIMGHCIAGEQGICSKVGIDCYQNGTKIKKSNMTLKQYNWLINQCKGKVFQVALGGRGDPNKHENFEDILKETRKLGIVPNMTTSGYKILEKEISLMSEYCGAVAVSYYSRLNGNIETNENTIIAIRELIKKGCITNIHYVVSKENIDECIKRLKNEIWPERINAIIFLLYKPVGLGKKEKELKYNEKILEFLDLAINKKHDYKVGFDTCFSTILKDNESINKASIDFCESARFSMYIDSELNAYPCSFGGGENKYKVKLNPLTIKQAWESDNFIRFLNQENDKCKNCNNKCDGGCKLNFDIVLCQKN